MTVGPPLRPRVVGLDLTRRGLGFAVLAGDPVELLDWGVAGCRRDGLAPCVDRTRALITDYRAAHLVLETWDVPGFRHGARGRDVLAGLAARLADEVTIVTHTPADVRQALGLPPGANKDAVAAELTLRFPELRPRLPPRRKIWQSEAYSMSIFDAVALALTHLERAGR